MSRLTGCIGVSLTADDHIEAHYYTGPTGMVFATLRIGDALGIDAREASPEVLRQIAAKAEELAAWQERQDAAEPDVAAEVDAEDRVSRPVSVPFKRDAVAA